MKYDVICCCCLHIKGFSKRYIFQLNIKHEYEAIIKWSIRNLSTKFEL